MKARVLGVTLGAIVALLCMSGVAAAKSHAKAPVQQGNGFCGANETGDPVIGSVKFKRTGNVVTVKVKLKGAPPNTTFAIQLWGAPCGFLGENGSITTDSKGKGKGEGTFPVNEGETEFFADPFSFEVGDNDTPLVSLP